MKASEKFAEDFCKSTGTEITVEYAFTGPCVWDCIWNPKHDLDHYHVVITRNDEFMVKYFVYDVFDSGRGKIPTTYEVLQSLEMYNPGRFGDFLCLNNWGITNHQEYMMAIKTYGLAKKEYSDVLRVFDGVIDELRKIW